MEDSNSIKNNVRMILGLDVSTRCVGITLASVDEGGELSIKVVTHLRPKIPTKIKGTEALFMKSRIIGEELKKYAECHITDVVIEEPLIGSNNANTAATLLRFNGMISQSVYDTIGVVPTFISSYDARKYACPQLMTVRKYNKKGDILPEKKILSSLKKDELVLFGEYPFDCAKKLILWNIISERYPKINWQYKANGDLKDENFDASDSLICVMGYIGMLKYAETCPHVSEWHKSEDGRNIVYNVDFCGMEIKHNIEII